MKQKDTRIEFEAASYQSPEVWDKVTGRAVYGVDLKLPGMLVGKILRSPHAHARIKNIDLAEADAMPGVRVVLSGLSAVQKPFGIVYKDEIPLAVDTVRYIGDEVAAVAAVDEETAARALAAIKVDYEPLPAVYTPAEALQAGAPLLHAAFPGNVAWERTLERGDVERALREADCIVEETFTTPMIHQLHLEPMSCLAAPDSYHGLTLYTAVQSPHIVRDFLAEALNLQPSRLQIKSPVMGGGFGARVFGNLNLYLITAMLALQAGRPVKVQFTREDEFNAGRPLVAAAIKMKIGLRRDGTLLARKSEIIVDNGAYSSQGPWVAKTLSERNDSLYRIPNIKYWTRLVYTNKVPTGQYRAYGNQTANFAAESLLDMAAAKLKMDPLELRLKNCVTTGDVSAHGLQIKSCALKSCFEKAAAEIGWHQKKPGRGYGISGAIHGNGSIVAHEHFVGASAEARLERDGFVSIFTGEQDYGQGAHGLFASIAAKVLELPVEKIIINSKDTATTPFSQGAFAMRQTTIGGNAVLAAAENLKKLIIKEAAHLLQEEAIFSLGEISGASGRKIPLTEVAHSWFCRNNGFLMSANGVYDPGYGSYDETGYGDISVTYSFAAHAAEVEVDPQTGELKIHRLIAVHDSGKILNYLTSKGQLYGGVTQGLGYACSEGYIFDGGKVLNADLAGYQIPTALDVPLIQYHFIEEEDREGPFGAKGLGEIVQVPVLGAVVNAAADAAGVRVTDLPITPEKIYRAGKGKECLD